MPFSNGVNNAGGMPSITANRGSFPTLGLPFQLYLDVLTSKLWYDHENDWYLVKADAANPYTFSTGLTDTDYTVTANLSTGVAEGNQSVIGGNTLNPLAFLNLIANAGDGIGSFLQFYSPAVSSRFFQDSGNWNFGGTTDPGFVANFANDVNFEADIYGNSFFGNEGSIGSFSALEMNGTGGSAVLKMVRNSVTPTALLNTTVFFADNSGKLSWFNSTGSYQRTFDATGITAARTWTLPDATTTLAGLAVANVFTQPQTIPPGSISATSLNFGTAGTGIYGDATSVKIATSATYTYHFSNGNLTLPGNLYIGGTAVKIIPQSSGVLMLQDTAGTSFDRLQFGGNSSSFPSLKRSTTKLQARLADDSGYCNIQGKLQTDNAYVATPQVPTGYIVIYDSTGTAYKVPCNV